MLAKLYRNQMKVAVSTIRTVEKGGLDEFLINTPNLIQLAKNLKKLFLINQLNCSYGRFN